MNGFQTRSAMTRQESKVSHKTNTDFAYDKNFQSAQSLYTEGGTGRYSNPFMFELISKRG